MLNESKQQTKKTNFLTIVRYYTQQVRLSYSFCILQWSTKFVQH